MAKQLVVIALIIVTSLASATTLAQGGTKQPAQAVAAPNGSVATALDIAVQNQPSAVAANNQKPPTTLDDYTQERWRLKLQTIVPYVLIATPIILLIVLVAIRFSGVRSPEHIMLAAALVLVIQATLTVSMTAEGSDSLSASMGILGAIAGYLFGRSRQDATSAPAASGKDPVHALAPRPDAPETATDRRAA